MPGILRPCAYASALATNASSAAAAPVSPGVHAENPSDQSGFVGSSAHSASVSPAGAPATAVSFAGADSGRAGGMCCWSAVQNGPKIRYRAPVFDSTAGGGVRYCPSCSVSRPPSARSVATHHGS